MAKITKFNTKPEFYFQKAVELSEKGEYVQSLEFLRSALAKTPYLSNDYFEIRLEIADTYAQMGLLELSNKEFFCISEYPYCAEECYYNLIKNFALSGQAPLAAHYINSGIESGILDSEDDFEPINTDVLKSRPLRLLKPNDNEYTLNVAKQLMASDNSSYAKQMLLTIKNESNQYSEAQNCLALIEMSEGNFKAGLEKCDEILAFNENDINALTTKILGLKMMKKSVPQQLLETLDSIDFSSWPGVAKIAMCMAELENDLLTNKYTKRVFEYFPYEKEMLLLYALSSFNLGDRIEAKDALVKLCVIYPGDYTVRYFAREIDKRADNERFFLTSELPSVHKLFLNEKLEEWLKDTELKFYSNYYTKNDEIKDDFFDVLHWALYNCDDATAQRAGEKLPESLAGLKIAKELLCENDFPVTAKKAVLHRILKGEYLRSIQIVLNNQIKIFNPSLPKNVKNDALTEAYYKVYSTLAFIESNFDRKLNINVKKLAQDLESACFSNPLLTLNPNVLAAILAYKTQINKIFSLNSYCCEVFDCEMEEFVLYSKLLGTSEN